MQAPAALDKPPMLTPEQVAERCAVHVQTVLNWIKTGQLKAKRAGRQFRIEQEDLNTFLIDYEPQRGGGNVQKPRRTQTEE